MSYAVVIEDKIKGNDDILSIENKSQLLIKKNSMLEDHFNLYHFRYFENFMTEGI